MHLHLRKTLFTCFYTLFLLCSSPLLAQQNITLTFNEEGRLISEPLPRLKFNECIKNCKEIYQLKVRVLMPLDYFNDEKIKIDTMAQEVYTSLKVDAVNSPSILYKLLACGDGSGLMRLKNIVKDRDILRWNLPEKDNSKNEEIIPIQLMDYVRFIRRLDSLKAHADDKKTVDSLLAILNDTTNLKFSPFRLRVKGYQIEDNCMRFTEVKAGDNYCKCVLPGKKYIAVEFGIPRGLIKTDAALDSFQVVQLFYMKQFAINRYNTLLASKKDDIQKLKALQKNIKDNTDEVPKILKALDSLSLISETCVGEDRKEKIDTAMKKIAELEEKLEKKMGAYDCDTICNSNNILFCSKVLPGWLLKLIWLNGDLIRLNPFRFTNQSIAVPANKSETPSKTASGAAQPVISAGSTVPSPSNNKETATTSKEPDVPLLMKDDSTKIAFWNSAIAHLQDSVIRDKKINLDSAKTAINKLIEQRDIAQSDLDKMLANKKKADENKKANDDDNAKNISDLNSFTTTTKIKYKGWLVPYRTNSATNKDRMWLRNYYYSSVTGLRSEDKFKYAYPEDEKLTLLVHNLTPGMSLKITESISPASDSSAWNIFASDAIKEVTKLYASVQPIAGLVTTALKGLNTKQSGLQPSGQVTINHYLSGGSKLGIPDSTFEINDAKDSTIASIEKLKKKVWPDGGMLELVTKKKSSSVTISLNSVTNKTQIADFFQQVLSEVVTDTTTCYTKYLFALAALRSAPDFIDEPLKETEDSVPSYFTYRYQLNDSVPTYIDKYTISAAASEKAEATGNAYNASSFVKVAPYHYFYLAAGIAYTPSAGAITSVDTTGGGFKINRDQDKARLIVGVRYYPLGLYNLKNPASLFTEGRWLHRLSILAATGIPKPLENLYVGVGFDVFPGLTFSAGSHFQQNNKYTISNNQVLATGTHYSPNVFYSITMDPTLFVSAITSIFKK